MMAAQSTSRLGHRGWVCKFPSWCLCISRQKALKGATFPTHMHVWTPVLPQQQEKQEWKMLCPVSRINWAFPKLFRLCPTCTAPSNVWHLPEPPPSWESDPLPPPWMQVLGQEFLVWLHSEGAAGGHGEGSGVDPSIGRKHCGKRGSSVSTAAEAQCPSWNSSFGLCHLGASRSLSCLYYTLW